MTNFIKHHSICKKTRLAEMADENKTAANLNI